ncbi:hypothetical protein [Deinococcus peraridilitoris]|uniref:hypothetical protein n=1 Tax=Deinococcus peraridilitoris TaxID=432329 RepID=UPI000A00723B|nr:hypothetical protein [Deinococcus peraridilitoris]
MKLPARVRISRLPGPPEGTLLTQMRRLNPQFALGAPGEPAPDDFVCLVVIAGGKPVGFLVAQRTGTQWQETQALESTWRGRGIEEALQAELRGLLSR